MLIFAVLKTNNNKELNQKILTIMKRALKNWVVVYELINSKTNQKYYSDDLLICGVSLEDALKEFRKHFKYHYNREEKCEIIMIQRA